VTLVNEHSWDGVDFLLSLHECLLLLTTLRCPSSIFTFEDVTADLALICEVRGRSKEGDSPPLNKDKGGGFKSCNREFPPPAAWFMSARKAFRAEPLELWSHEPPEECESENEPVMELLRDPEKDPDMEPVTESLMDPHKDPVTEPSLLDTPESESWHQEYLRRRWCL
jgi:hypothetical protein